MAHPLAIALSGGGDSMALLQAAAGWARDHGRRLLALTVDHGLSPDSASWMSFARDAAGAAGADWRGLAWAGAKPSTGLPAAARAARHRLIAEAARAAGARVVLLAHTADDAAEGEWMRREGSTLGRLREWSPSPAWPEGRGLMLLRPLLDVGRAELRDWLGGQGARWIDDPANADLRFTRSRARAAGAGGGALPDRPLADRAGPPPVALGGGLFEIDRSVAARDLAATLVCAGGEDRPPRSVRLDRIIDRLRSGVDFAAVLCGARVEALGDQVLVCREAGEFARGRLGPLPLEPGVEAVWDGRWAVSAAAPGWSVAPAAGRMAALSKPDRARLAALPRLARPGRPVLIRNDATAPVLATPSVELHSLAEERLTLALDRMTHERELGSQAHGAAPRNHLFSGADITEAGRAPRSQGPKRA